MTREELCNVIGLPAETPPAGLVQARAGRLTELQSQLRQEGLPKPVKIKLAQELIFLESREAVELTAQLEIMGQIEGYFGEIDAELAKPNPAHGVVSLCLEKIRPLVPGIKEEPVRFGFEKRIAGVAERPKTPVETTPRAESRAPLDGVGRIEAYFSEIASELAKPEGLRGVIRLCLEKVKRLVEQVPDEEMRFGFEKRIIEVEERLGWRQSVPPFQFNKPAPAGGSTPPAPAPEKKSTPSRQPMPAGNLPDVPPPPEKKSHPPLEKKTAPLPGTLLQLIPARMEGTLRQMGVPVHLVARPRFLLGRRRASVDFVTWFLPETTENQEKTDTISRVNTTFSLKGSQIMVQDGEVLEDGKTKASAFGTIIDGQPITTAIPLNFNKERRLKLGQFAYELAALQLAAVAPEGPLAKSDATLSTMPTLVLPKRPLGCLRFLPLSCRDVRIVAVWMFSEATLGSGAQCAVKLDAADLPPIAVRFHHWQDGFWLEVPFGGSSMAALDGRRLAAGDVLPLQAAHEFRLGELNYDIRIS
jgi:hypothetical protein